MKKGISLIVLVITIIVMIILAAGVLITLSNTSIINKASNAVDLTNESQVQDLAALLWADAYMDNKRDEVLVEKVKTKLEQYGIKEDNWKINITNEGIHVLISWLHSPSAVILEPRKIKSATVSTVSYLFAMK